MNAINIIIIYSIVIHHFHWLVAADKMFFFSCSAFRLQRYQFSILLRSTYFQSLFVFDCATVFDGADAVLLRSASLENYRRLLFSAAIVHFRCLMCEEATQKAAFPITYIICAQVKQKFLLRTSCFDKENKIFASMMQIPLPWKATK